MSRPRTESLRQWLLPIGLLGGVGLGAFTAAYWLDHRLLGRSPGEALRLYLDFDADRIADAISQASPVVVALLGIVVTVVAIIVQLASTRYSGVAQMFLRDRINQVVLSYYVVTAIVGAWLSVSLHGDFVPRIALVLSLCAATLGMLLMLPYFAYVFRFLEPGSLVRRIRRQAVRVVPRSGLDADLPPPILHQRQGQLMDQLAELTDIASRSVAHKDRIIASRAIDALRDFARDYLARKSSLPRAWFGIGPALLENPDFMAMDPGSLADLESRRVWVEWQVLRQYLSIYGEASGSMREINYLIAMDTRSIGAMAAQRGEDELIALCLRYMNSYLRVTLNARDVRTAYNVLNQYRQLGEAMLKHGRGDRALETIRHMSYYGHVGFDLTLNFVTETVAFDVSSLCEAAHACDSPELDAMLRMFLKLDRPLRMKAQERGLLGVRKAQAKLGAYLLAAGDDARARLVVEDMRDESSERLAIIRSELEAVDAKDFWEIVDRGHTFEYMPAAQRAALPRFFELLGEVQARVAAAPG